MTRRLGFWLAGAAFAVNGPRWVLTYLEAEGEGLTSESLRSALVTTSATGTGISLTLGGCYLAYVLGSSREHSGLLRSAVLACWLTVLASTVVLLSPMLVSGILRSSLQDVLSVVSWAPWLWAVVAVAVPEVVVAGFAFGQILLNRERDDQLSAEQVLEQVALERNRLLQKCSDLEATLRESDEATSPTSVAPEGIGERVFCRFDCGRDFPKKRSERGHISSCPKNPENREAAA